ncbi:MAG: hypothetical protein ACR2GO_06215 [Candidatus Limnocylindria bacterium]
MHPRLLGVLAVVGGTAWLAKVAFIWANDGANRYGGVAGVLMMIGLTAIAGAAMTRAWYLPSSTRTLWRVLSAAAALLAVVAAINLGSLLVGSLLAWVVIGETWFAGEVGLVLVAVLALVVGAQWIKRGSQSSPQPR